jgi:hypothetical protein
VTAPMDNCFVASHRLADSLSDSRCHMSQVARLPAHNAGPRGTLATMTIDHKWLAASAQGRPARNTCDNDYRSQVARPPARKAGARGTLATMTRDCRIYRKCSRLTNDSTKQAGPLVITERFRSMHNVQSVTAPMDNCVVASHRLAGRLSV